MRSAKENTRAEKLYKNYKEKNDELINSNSERLHRLLVTLSTAGLGVSLTVMPKLFPFEKMLYVPLLYFSWISFVSVLIGTIVSLFFSATALKKAIKYAKKYYLEGRESYFNKKSCAYCVTAILKYFSAVMFCVAMLFSLIFVMVNISVHIN